MATRAQAKRAATLTPGEKVVTSIRKGECDTHVAEILEALQMRVLEGHVATRWRVQLDGLDVSEDDLLLDEAFRLEKALGVSWGEINPLETAEHAMALFRVLLGRTLEDEQVRERIDALTVKQVMGAITRESVVDPPKD